jgi:hypothetical protein
VFEYSICSVIHLLNQKVQVKPAILLPVLVVKCLNIRALPHRYPLVEEHYPLFLRQPLRRLLDLSINLELHDLLQLADVEVITDMKSEEKLADNSLSVDHLSADALNDDSEQGRVLEAEIFEFDFPLGFIRERTR